MENNNFQNEVNQNEVNQNQVNSNNVNEVKNNKQKNNKTLTMVLLVVVLVLVMVAGIIGGLLISGNRDKVTNIVNQGTEKREENKASKKIDESKPWVYDADYLKENKKIYQDSAKTEKYAVNSDKDLVVPYININSDDAKKVNETIKALYEKYYEKYGEEKVTPYGDKIKVYYHYGLEYDKYENDNILSVIITLYEGETVVDGGTGGGISTTYTYNFNLDSLNEASLDEMAVRCGFSSGKDVTSKITDWEKKQKEILAKADNSDIFVGVQDNKYFIDGNGKLNFLYRTSTSATFDHLQPIENGKEIELFYTEEQANEQIKINNEAKQNQKSLYFEQNQNLNYTSNPKDNINGKVAIIKMGEKTFQTTKHNGYYTYTDNFGNSYNIKEITNITSEYRMTSTDGETNLFRAVIEYIDNNNAKKSFDTAVFVPNDANNYITLRIFGPYENYTGSTNFVRTFTDLYDDGSVNTSIFSSFANLTYKNANFKIKNQENTYSCEIKFDNTGKPTLNVISVSDVHNEAVFVTNDITNIKQDIAAGTSYVTFDFTAWTPGGDVTGTAQMRFSNVSSNESIGVKVSFDDMLSNFDNNGDYIELNKVK